MFTLSSPDLPTSEQSPGSGAPLPSLEPADVGGALAVFSTQLDSLLFASAIATIPSYSGGTITLTLPDTVGQVTLVEIDGVTYQYPSIRFSALTHALTITLLDWHRPIVGTAIAYNYLLSALLPEYAPSGELVGEPFPESFQAIESVYGALQSFSCERGFEQHPSASLNFTALQSQEGLVRRSFAGNTPIIAYGRGYAVNTLNITRLSKKAFAEGRINVSVSLKGLWETPLANPVDLSNSLTPTLIHFANGQGIQMILPANPTYNNVEPGEVSTVGSELDAIARIYNSFQLLSKSSGVELRQWGQTKVHYLSEADIWSDIQIQCENKGLTPGGGAPASEADRNSPEDSGTQPGDTGNTFEDDSYLNPSEFENTELETQNDERQQTEVRRNVRIELYEGDRSPSIPPSFADLRSGNACFDSGGFTKSRKKTVRLNGQPISETEEKWGFVYHSNGGAGSSDPAIGTYSLVSTGSGRPPTPIFKGDQISGIVPGNFWRKVEETQTLYNYGQFGYLESIERRGYRLARFKSESGIEAVELQAQLNFELTSGLPAGEAVRRQEAIDLYTRFYQLPITDTTTYQLESMIGLYPDVKRPSTTEELADWVEPKYAAATVRVDSSIITTANPESTDDAPLPPIFAGRDFREESQLTIVYPQSGQSERSFEDEKCIYTERRITKNSQGESLKNALVLEEFTDNPGRVGQHTRLELVSGDDGSIGTPTPETEGESDRRSLRSPGTDRATPSTETISYRGADTYQKAYGAAETDNSISNTFRAEVWQFVVDPRFDFDEGDRILAPDGTMLVVQQVSEERTYRNGSTLTQGWQVQAGKLIKPQNGIVGGNT